MTRRHACFFSGVCLIILGCDPEGFGDKPDKAEPAKTAAPTPAPSEAAKVKVEKGPFKIETTLRGALESRQTQEVAFKLKGWSLGLPVKKAAEHGSIVKKGDVLVEFDTEKLDLAIKDLKTDHALGELSLKLAEDELPILEKTLPIDLAITEEAKKQADEDLKKFLEIDKPLSVEGAEFTAKSASHYLEYAKEELKQLEKMYRTKDLTEETEEIILKRQRHQVESAQFSLKSALMRRDQTLKVELPRKELAAKESAAKQSLAWDKARFALPLSLSQKRLALSKQQADFAKAVENLKKLELDRASLPLLAPCDGVVYYGKCTRGQWTTGALIAAKLVPGSPIIGDEVLMTIVGAPCDMIRSTVDEKDLHLVQAGLNGKFIPTAFPDLKLAVKIAEIGSVPRPAGGFEAVAQVESAKDAARLMPALTGVIKLVSYSKDDALTVPSSCVFTDDSDDEKHFVYLSMPLGKSEKRSIKVGKSANGKTEILEGLKEGEEILPAKPTGPVAAGSKP